MKKQRYKRGTGKTFYNGDDFYAVMKWISDNVEIDVKEITSSKDTVTCHSGAVDGPAFYDALRNKIVITIKYVS